MLAQLALALVISAICMACGELFYVVVLRRTKDCTRPFIVSAITGLIVITFFAQIWALFNPVNASFTIFCMLSILTGSLWHRKKMNSFFKALYTPIRADPRYALAIALVLLIATLSAGPTTMDDTESYHIPMIQWLHQYGTVKGIANLHERYGFNSSWFTDVSFFLVPFPTRNFFSALNGTISIWLGLYLLRMLPVYKKAGPNSVGSSQALCIVILFFAMACWPMIRGNASSANYDFVSTVLIIVLFAEASNNRGQTGTFLDAEWFLWPVYLFTVRIVNYPLLLLTLYAGAFYISKKSWNLLLINVIAGTGLIFAFIARNICLSGYPLYPALQFDIFTCQWKADRNTTAKTIEYIRYFNRVSTAYLDIQETKKLRFPAWVGEWFRHLFNYDKLILIPGSLGYVVYFLRSKIHRGYSRPLPYLIIVLFLQLVSWFLIAPDPRFVYGALLCGTGLLFVNTKKDILIPLTAAWNYLILALAVGIFVLCCLKPIHDKNYRNFILPYRMPQPPLKHVQIDDIILNIPEAVNGNWNPRCFGSPLPCLYYVNPKLRAIGKTIEEGFYLEK